MKNTHAAFLRYEILKAQERINVDELWYHVHQFILPSADSYCSFRILFIYHALISCSFHVQCIMFIFTMYVRCSPFFLIVHVRNQMLLIKWVIFFWSSKIFFCTFQHSQSGRIYNVVSTLINVVKLDVKNNDIVSTLSNVPNINVEKDNVDLTLLNVNIHNVVSTLIWYCPTSRCHFTLTTIFAGYWRMLLNEFFFVIIESKHIYYNLSRLIR